MVLNSVYYSILLVNTLNHTHTRAHTHTHTHTENDLVVEKKGLNKDGFHKQSIGCHSRHHAGKAQEARKNQETFTKSQIKEYYGQPGMVAHAYNLSTLEG